MKTCSALLSLPLLLAMAMSASAADPPDGAVAACQKHVESLMREAVDNSYDDGLQVQRLDPQTVQVAGRITSRRMAGDTTRAGFRCQAKRYGVLWTTRTELTTAH